MRMANPIPQFQDLVTKVNNIGIGCLNIIESRVSEIDYTDGMEKADWAQDLFDGVVIATGGYLPDPAHKYVDSKPDKKGLVAFGRRYVANPDFECVCA